MLYTQFGRLKQCLSKELSFNIKTYSSTLRSLSFIFSKKIGQLASKVFLVRTTILFNWSFLFICYFLSSHLFGKKTVYFGGLYFPKDLTVCYKNDCNKRYENNATTLQVIMCLLYKTSPSLKCLQLVANREAL